VGEGQGGGEEGGELGMQRRAFAVQSWMEWPRSGRSVFERGCWYSSGYPEKVRWARSFAAAGTRALYVDKMDDTAVCAALDADDMLLVFGS
jgi:hypothetical protein